MARPRTMTRFAADADLGPVRLKSIGNTVVRFAQTGGMAVRAHEVPVLRRPRPVQLVVVRNSLLRIEMKPALAAFPPGAGIPRDRQCLNAAVWKFNEVLL